MFGHETGVKNFIQFLLQNTNFAALFLID